MFAVSASALLFSVVVHALVDKIAKCLNPFRHELSENQESKPKYVQRQHFIWQNTCVSFVHAFVSGIWSLSTFYFEPDFLTDLINLSTWRSISLVSYSLGYFIFDSLHMAILHPYRSTAEFLVHHFVIFLCFSSALLSGNYIGYAVVSLLPEVNSIFLHLRRAMNYLHVPKRNPIFRAICLLNISSFIVFRFMVLSWMTRWIVINRDRVPFGYYCLGSVGLAVLMVMNIVLFIRVVYADFLTNNTVSSAALLVSAAGSSTGAPGKPHLSVHSSYVSAH
ncbi:unnamed protein product [Schistosoma intercalatum]|nr:unnamed protein product [Schistosoma intercalatum]CAH8537756.1 unnamed protein product [Schistosoma intercalatum]